MIPPEWSSRYGDLVADICDPTKFISIHHLQAPQFIARNMAAAAAVSILDNWEGATLYYGTQNNERKQVISAIKAVIEQNPGCSDPSAHAVDYATLTRSIETTPFHATTNLAILLEADADMSIDYAHCIIAISQKLRGLNLESSDGQGGIRLLTVSRDSFDDRLRKLLSIGDTLYQRVPREVRLEFPEECIIEEGGLQGLPRHFTVRKSTARAGGNLRPITPRLMEIQPEINDIWLEAAAQIASSNKKMHLIVCFEPWPDLARAEDAVEKMNTFGSFTQRPTSQAAVSSPYQPLAAFFTEWLHTVAWIQNNAGSEVLQGDSGEEKHVFLALVRDGMVPSMEVVFAGCDEFWDQSWNLILILGNQTTNCHYQQSIHNVHSVELESGIIERWDQLSWLTAVPGDAVVVDRYGWALEAAKAWRERGAGYYIDRNDKGWQYRRVGSSAIEGSRLADFLVLLAAERKERNIASHEVHAIIASLITQRRPWRHVMAQLVYQRVLNVDEPETLSDGSTKNPGPVDMMRLPRIEMDGPGRALSKVELLRSANYDYRLALLLSVHPTDPNAVLSKILLGASILCGMDRLLVDRNGELDQLARAGPLAEYDIESLAKSAAGILSEIASFGTWWLKIGLWHRVGWLGQMMNLISSGRPQPEKYGEDLPNGKRCEVLFNASYNMMVMVKKLDSVLGRLQLSEQSPLDRWPLDTPGIPRPSLTLFYGQLTSAFILDLVECRFVKQDTMDCIRVSKVHSDLVMEPRWGYITSMIRNILRGQRTDSIFGIVPTTPTQVVGYGGRRVHLFDEWIWIPTRCLNDWHQRHHPNEELSAGLVDLV
ncbi:unnamed protein product [Clonostachys rosea f. rosea IK726]|uniref:Uncharacterized protein n=1 Tax=Clonostachys rosea f. rosea IK726 TaxID=1349383 RepID=A0ACA9UE40_BIOOC|nr:unnamed protein product [Clonostachys rosea f. rosea IK726]